MREMTFATVAFALLGLRLRVTRPGLQAQLMWSITKESLT